MLVDARTTREWSLILRAVKNGTKGGISLDEVVEQTGLSKWAIGRALFCFSQYGLVHPDDMEEMNKIRELKK